MRVLETSSPAPSLSAEIRPIEILLVEDSPGDIRLTLETLSEAKVENRLATVRDGHEAMLFLRQERAFAQAFRPDLILLDLNLPRKDGREVLAEIKGDSKLADIPVVILTGSAAEEDILRAYNLNVNSYVTKPLDLEQLIGIVRSVREFRMAIIKVAGES